MTNSQRLATVRTCLLRWIAQYAPRPAIGALAVDRIVGESILIRDEFYVGRRFRTDSYHAVWFIEEDELKIYDGEDRLCAVLTAAEIDALDSSPAVIKMVAPVAFDREDQADGEVRRAA